MFALVAMPVVVTAGALYGSGKLVEGIGRGLSAGPGAVLKAYRKIDEKIKGDKDKDAGAGAAEREREEERWHRYQQQQQYQEQQRYQYQHEQQYGYERGEGGRGLGGAMGEEGLKPKPKLEERGLRTPMGASLMEDPSIGTAGGSGSIRAKN